MTVQNRVHFATFIIFGICGVRTLDTANLVMNVIIARTVLITPVVRAVRDIPFTKMWNSAMAQWTGNWSLFYLLLPLFLPSSWHWISRRRAVRRGLLFEHCIDIIHTA